MTQYDNKENVRVTEHTTFKVPYELLNKRFRAGHKVFERETKRVAEDVSSVETALLTPDNKKKVVDALGKLCSDLKESRTRLTDAIADEEEVSTCIKRRAVIITEAQTTDPATCEAWSHARNTRLLADYLLRNGHTKTATQLAKAEGVYDLVNFEHYRTQRDIVDSIINEKDTSKALAWCVDNRSKLKKLESAAASSSLEIELHKQQFVCLIRQKNQLGAIEYAKKHLQSAPETDFQQLMALLVFPIGEVPRRYHSLVSLNQWIRLAKKFEKTSSEICQLSDTSPFALSLKIGLSGLKMKQCMSKREGDRNPQCPVCGPHMNNIAKLLPYSQNPITRVRCRLTGEPIDENNPPLMLPNGQIYGTMGIHKSLDQHGAVICPFTGLSFALEECKKIFIM